MFGLLECGYLDKSDKSVSNTERKISVACLQETKGRE